MFYFWREATAALVPGFLCQSGRRHPENVSILSSLLVVLWTWPMEPGSRSKYYCHVIIDRFKKMAASSSLKFMRLLRVVFSSQQLRE